MKEIIEKNDKREKWNLVLSMYKGSRIWIGQNIRVTFVKKKGSSGIQIGIECFEEFLPISREKRGQD